MKNTGINPVVIKEIRQMAQQCGLVRVILFGSRNLPLTMLIPELPKKSRRQHCAICVGY